MKAIVRCLVALGCAMIFAACANSINNDSPDVKPGTVGTADPALLEAAALAKTMSADDVVLFYYRKDGNYSPWGLWSWEKVENDGEAGYNATLGKAEKSGAIGYWNISKLLPDLLTKIRASDNMFYFIIRNAAWNKDPGPDQTADLSSAKKFMVLSGDSSVYEISDNIGPSIVSAVATTSTTIKVALSVSLGLEIGPSDNGFILVSEDGQNATVSDVRNFDSLDNRNRNNARNLLLTVSSIDASKTWYLKHPAFAPEKGVAVTMVGAVKDLKAYEGDDLGLTLDGSRATFKVWAPVADEVTLLLYDDVTKVGEFNDASVKAKSVGSTTDETLKGQPALTQKMTSDKQSGVWTYTLDNVTQYKYYKYQIVNSGITYYVCDINAKAASPDAIAAQIVDINKDTSAIPSGLSYGAKSGYKNPFSKSYTEAVIYEMHITDWSYADDSSTGNVGKYLTIANGTKVIEHLKDLGVTHVQILPIFEFAETNANTGYNWGYNPYHYNVPEGRYVTAGYTDGTQAVLELRTLIAELHKAGIAVIMDVVYNHTNGIMGGSLYDSTVPYYYYRFDDSGAYSNGSGCGNEVDTEAPMMKKYIIDSLKHWMLDYHFNGFRFDLMGCFSKETMKEIYEALYAIDPSVLVYGEPWTGGTAAVKNEAVQAVTTSAGVGVGAFDDDFRDAIKGAEFGGFKKGQVQGTYNDTAIINGLLGKPGNNKRNDTGKLGLALHYVECHDNYTLFDKLALSYLNKTSGSGNLVTQIKDTGVAEVKKQDKLAAAYVFLSQGTAFMNGGQEFLRTKRGNENSYNTNANKTNSIDLALKDTYLDVYNTYKGLIALRRANPAAFGSNASAKAEKVSDGVTKYTTGSFLVYFNATDKDVSISASGYTKAVDVSGGEPKESAQVPSSVPAKSFVILKK